MTNDVRADRTAQIAVGLLRPCLLAQLVGASAYGYELHQRLLSIGLECDLGTVYRSLNAMEDEGLLRSSWERSSGGRSRRRYELSSTGAGVVDSYVAPVEQLVAVAEAFLDMRRDVPHEDGRGPAVDREHPDPLEAPLIGRAATDRLPGRRAAATDRTA